MKLDSCEHNYYNNLRLKGVELTPTILDFN